MERRPPLGRARPLPGLPENTLWSGSVPTQRASIRWVTLGLGEPKPPEGSLRGAPRGLHVAGPLHGLRKPFLFHCSHPAASQPRPPLTSLCPRTRSLRPSPAPASGSRPTPRLSMLQPLSSPGRSLPPTHRDRGGRLKKNFQSSLHNACFCGQPPRDTRRMFLKPVSSFPPRGQERPGPVARTEAQVTQVRVASLLGRLTQRVNQMPNSTKSSIWGFLALVSVTIYIKPSPISLHISISSYLFSYYYYYFAKGT